MKIAKILSAASAAVVAAAAVAATASATLTVPETHDAGLSVGTGMWLVQLFNTGNEAENKPAVDYGIALDSIASISVTVVPLEPDWWDGQIGGSIITSCGPASATPADHNWPNNEYWGVNDADLGLEADASKAVVFEKTGDLTYTGTVTLGDNNCIYDVSSIEGGYAQVGLQEWGSAMTDVTVTDLTCYDAAGNVVISFDGNGVVDTATGSSDASGDNGAASGDASSDGASSEGAATTPDKGSPDTGVEGVAAVAGVAIVAAGAVVLSKKRK